jgi:hypothetical protein
MRHMLRLKENQRNSRPSRVPIARAARFTSFRVDFMGVSSVRLSGDVWIILRLAECLHYQTGKLDEKPEEQAVKARQNNCNADYHN